VKAHSHHQAVIQRRQHRVLAREAVGAAEDHAVGGDQGQEIPRILVELVAEGLHQQFDAGHGRGDDHHEGRQAHRLGGDVANQGHGGIRGDQHEAGRDTEAQGIDDAAGHGQQRAQAEQLHDGRDCFSTGR
jgi:hypothetical protein